MLLRRLGPLTCLVCMLQIGTAHAVVIGDTTLEPAPANALARDSMRTLSSKAAIVYYAEGERSGAERLLHDLSHCIKGLQARLPDSQDMAPMHVIFHRGEQNNAFVQAGPGIRQRMVLPMHLTVELFNLYNLGLVDHGLIACHESVHYAMFQQRHGPWGFINNLFGTLLVPEAFLDTWFNEGVATHYEARLSPQHGGRPTSPWWRGLFAAGVAGRGHKLHGGELSGLQRRSAGSGGSAPYLMGMHFVDYLIETYGEARLWRLIRAHNAAILPPIGVSLRFESIYGRDLSALFSDFGAWIDRAIPVRQAPPDQERVATGVGRSARLASCPAAGLLATVSEDVDRPSMLTLQDEGGGRRWQRNVVDVLPPRTLLQPTGFNISGLAFQADCRALYFVATDLGSNQEYVTRLLRVDASSGRTTGNWLLHGVGGDISPDGDRYAYVHIEGDQARLAALHLNSGRVETLYAPATHTSLATPAWAPDGRRLAFTARGPDGFDLQLREADGQIRPLTHDGAFNYAARWRNNGALVHMRTVAGRVQAAQLNLSDGSQQVLTDAPYLVMDPVPGAFDGLLFLSNVGWQWHVERSRRPGTSSASDPKIADATSASWAVAAIQAARTGDGSVADGEPAAPPSPPLTTVDAAYQSTDSLWLPALRLPEVGFNTRLSLIDSGAKPLQLKLLSLTGTLAGQDRLARHSYAAVVTYDAVYRTALASFLYTYAGLAPWFEHLQLNYQRAVSDLSLSLSRAFWNTQVGLSMTGFYFPRGAGPTFAGTHFLLQPAISVAYSAAESTPFTDARRALSLSSSLRYFPNQVVKDRGFGLVSANISGVVPLPLSRRHTLSLNARGAMLIGTQQRLIAVGNVFTESANIYAGAKYQLDRQLQRPIQANAPFLALTPQPVLGFEDSALARNRYLLLSLVYHYPIILDYGWTSLFHLLPGPFIRQINIYAFTSTDVGNSVKRSRLAYGGEVQAQLAVSQLFNLRLGYRVAVRPQFRRGFRVLHLLWVGT